MLISMYTLHTNHRVYLSSLPADFETHIFKTIFMFLLSIETLNKNESTSLMFNNMFKRHRLYFVYRDIYFYCC